MTDWSRLVADDAPSAVAAQSAPSAAAVATAGARLVAVGGTKIGLAALPPASFTAASTKVFMITPAGMSMPMNVTVLHSPFLTAVYAASASSSCVPPASGKATGLE